MASSASQFHRVFRTLAARLSRPITPAEIALVGLAAVVLYFGSFFLLQRQVFVTYLCDSRITPSQSRFISIDLRYFSKIQPANTFCYRMYWPIHHWLMPHADAAKPFTYCEEFPRNPFYLSDVRGLP
jgi:hypothetical protein